jgi:alpha-amylase
VTKRAIVLYLHAHQPFRIGHFSTFDIGENKNYFDEPHDMRANNRSVLDKVIQKSYVPMNRKLLELMHQHPQFKVSLSITGTLIEQLEKWSPSTLESFKELVATDKVEIIGETYHHSLAFFYSLAEFNNQVQMHRDKIWEVFGKKPTVFRNTELSYNNDLAVWADRAGYKAVLAEGWDPILQWRSPNYVYRPVGTQTLKLLLKNYKLSDDIAFRFGDQNWESWPLTADKYVHWLNAIDNGTNINLFMDYETFGEHQWKESGIFDFLSHFPGEWLKNENNTFMTASESADNYEAVGTIDTPYTTTWADTERDLSAWLGNPMQQQAIEALYGLSEKILSSDDWALIEDWRKLQTSDHFYYMCTKWFNDGDIHAYFSPYDSPYIAFMNFMNAWHDLRFRLVEKGLDT